MNTCTTFILRNIHEIIMVFSVLMMTSTKYNRDWENTQKWLKDIKKSSGNSDLEKYNAYIEPKSKLEDKDKVPSYYFMYGMRIGERPQLMKNFLGKQPRTEKKKKDIGNMKVVEREEDNNMSEASYFTASSSQLKKDLARTKNNQIMVGDKVVIQVPIGYRQSCIRKHNWYDKCTSSGMKQENARIPQYYQQKYKNVILQDDMFT
ncbi:uncharacterized protein LOC143451325 isoform X2 [Clavelina lepadiformis]|uniref:uncharacterized protein LOC143451325 isoform X2 n=1 Tax=Clavelina lepadiformis TaxID=159417 RepID=UPI00404173B9